MYGEIKMKDISGVEKTVPMMANAATLIRFKQLFHCDLMAGIVSPDGNFDIDIVSKLGFIMAKQAAKADMNALTFDKYVEWIEEFDSMTFLETCNQIFGIYFNSRENSSEAKK